MAKQQPLHNVNGKSAYRIIGFKIAETGEAVYLNCEGDKHWFPKSSVRLDASNGTVDIQDWIYKQKFPKG